MWRETGPLPICLPSRLVPDPANPITSTRSYSQLRDCTPAALSQLVEIAATCVQHSRAHQFVDGVKHKTPSRRLITRSLEERMQVEALFPPSLRITAQYAMKVGSCYPRELPSWGYALIDSEQMSSSEIDYVFWDMESNRTHEERTKIMDTAARLRNLP